MVSPLIEQQIKTSVGNGLAKSSIEALLGRAFDNEENELYKKCRAIFLLQEKKRRQEKVYQRATTFERVRKHRDKISSIDEGFDRAYSEIDWERRRRAETSLGEWVKTYMCDGLALNEEPSPRGYEVLKQMDEALTSHRNYMICMGRGFGKSSYCICASLYALATGRQKFVMIISNNGSSSANLLGDLWRVIETPDTLFAHDYPDAVFAFQEARGSFHRR